MKRVSAALLALVLCVLLLLPAGAAGEIGGWYTPNWSTFTSQTNDYPGDHYVDYDNKIMVSPNKDVVRFVKYPNGRIVVVLFRFQEINARGSVNYLLYCSYLDGLGDDYTNNPIVHVTYTICPYIVLGCVKTDQGFVLGYYEYQEKDELAHPSWGLYELKPYDVKTGTEDPVYTDLPLNEIQISASPPGGGGQAPEDCRAQILLPRDGFQQSKLNAVVMKTYYKIPYNGSMNDIKISATGYLEGERKVQSHKVNVINDGAAIEGYLDLVGAVSWNKPCTLTLSVTDYQGTVYSDSITVTCYDDFVDVDGDGLDDRTGQDEWTGNPDFNDPPDVGGGGSVSVPDVSALGNVFEQLGGFSSDFVGFLGSFFTYIPASVWVLIGVGIAVVILLRILGR